MKKILQELQSIQDECIGRIKKEENGQLPKRVAGALIRSVKNTTTWEEWNLIRENIDNHSKDWRRFQKDPNKIVLEKNFFFNTLKKMGGLFIFRPSDDNGATYINPSDFFLTSKPRYWGPWRSILFSILAILSWVFSVRDKNVILLVLMFFFIVAAVWIFIKEKKNYTRRRVDWTRVFRDSPLIFFSEKIASMPKPVSSGYLHFGYLQSFLKINLDDTPFQKDYEKIIGQAMDISRKTKGKIAWLWRFGLWQSSRNDYFHIVDYKDAVHVQIDIEIKSKGSDLLPMIETENSFIFCLDYFSDEMEESYKNLEKVNEFLKDLRQEMINPEKTIASDNMFRAYRF